MASSPPKCTANPPHLCQGVGSAARRHRVPSTAAPPLPDAATQPAEPSHLCPLKGVVVPAAFAAVLPAQREGLREGTSVGSLQGKPEKVTGEVPCLPLRVQHRGKQGHGWMGSDTPHRVSCVLCRCVGERWAGAFSDQRQHMRASLRAWDIACRVRVCTPSPTFRCPLRACRTGGSKMQELSTSLDAGAGAAAAMARKRKHQQQRRRRRQRQRQRSSGGSGGSCGNSYCTCVSRKMACCSEE